MSYIIPTKEIQIMIDQVMPYRKSLGRAFETEAPANILAMDKKIQEFYRHEFEREIGK